MLSTKLYTRWPTINAHFLLSNTLTLNQHNITSAPPAPKKLFVVCCNATWNGPNESDWLVAPSQVGETDTYIAHIKGAFEALWDDERPGQSATIFSGGPVRRETQTSMGASYLSLCQSKNYFDMFYLWDCETGESTLIKSVDITDETLDTLDS